MAKRQGEAPKANVAAIQAGITLLKEHPLLSYLVGHQAVTHAARDAFPPGGFARVLVSVNRWVQTPICTVEVNPWRRAEPEEWAHVIAQAQLHIYLNHVAEQHADDAFRASAEAWAADMLRQISVGRRPVDLPALPEHLPGRAPAETAAILREQSLPELADFLAAGIAGRGQPAWVFAPGTPPIPEKEQKARTDHFASAIRSSIASAIETAGAAIHGSATATRNPNSMAERARRSFVATYPLLASLAAAFEIVEDADLCVRLDIAIAAVNAEDRRIFVNPKFPWTEAGMRFVIAHELLHVGLRHEPRRQGRDPYLWNVACDYVINGWLIEMGVGEVPTDGLLLDPELGFEKEAAEAIYDRIASDLRLLRRLNKARTLRGQGKVDMLGNRPPAWWTGPGTDLDAFYRRALAEGLDLHLARRGTLPSDLVEEIKALQHPPIPWDVELAQWLDAYFPPLERRRSFARASRRQSATPDIPRPVWDRPPDLMTTRTFAVVLDTSGSMSPRLLAHALGAIASYAMSREVPMVRLLQCDAAVHDSGFVAPESLLGLVEVRGRGGTVLQPAFEQLDRAADLPKTAPVLVITDGQCDTLRIAREHAFLMPVGARLPYRTAAPIFAFEET